MEEECLDAFRYGKKEEALKLLPKLSNPETVIDSYWDSSTLMHHAARHGWGDVCKLLVEKYNCEPTAVNYRHWSPLHFACWGGKENLVKYLITLQARRQLPGCGTATGRGFVGRGRRTPKNE